MRRCVPPCAAHLVEEELLHLGGAAPAYGNLRTVCKDQALGIQLRDCVDVYQVSLMGAQEAFAQKIADFAQLHVCADDLAVGVLTAAYVVAQVDHDNAALALDVRYLAGIDFALTSADAHPDGLSLECAKVGERPVKGLVQVIPVDGLGEKGHMLGAICLGMHVAAAAHVDDLRLAARPEKRADCLDAIGLVFGKLYVHEDNVAWRVAARHGANQVVETREATDM